MHSTFLADGINVAQLYSVTLCSNDFLFSYLSILNYIMDSCTPLQLPLETQLFLFYRRQILTGSIVCVKEKNLC
jgi:hypothetical protein